MSKVIFSKAQKLERNLFYLFRNEEYLAINKPVGIECIAGKEPGKQLIALMASMELIKAGNSIPVPINSLANDVSGVVLMSRNASAGKLARGILKTGQEFWPCKYWGLLSGKVPFRHTNGVINYPLLNGQPNSEGVVAITNWKLLKYANHIPLKETSLIEFEPRTNIPNQISIQAGHTLKMIPHMLHLHQMEASLPNGEHVSIVAPPRDDFLKFINDLGWK